MRLTADQIQRAKAIVEAPSQDFAELATLAGLNPAHDFKYARLRDIDFGAADLNGFDFTGADLTGSDLSRTAPPGPVLTDAVLYGARLPSPVEREEAPDLAPGWKIVGRDAIARIRGNPPPLDVMIQFFDGVLPTWQMALAQGVRPRAVADRVASRFRALHNNAPKPNVVLLTGAGGEGKSTAILHVAAALIEDRQQAWTCLYRQATNAGLPEGTFEKLEIKPDHAWLVVIDDADNIGPAILAAVKQIKARTDVHLLLAAREAEWQPRGLVPGIWEPAASFRPEPLAGLDREDAGRIVAGWLAWGDKAMGKLRDRSEAEAVAALLGHARDFATKREDGELLGALLVTRQGEDMRAHVRTLVNGLGRSPVIGPYSLRDIYAMVVAMHAERQLYLSNAVLAFALRCGADDLELKVLLPLRREAMLDSGDIYILSRHRRIAEAAYAVMREDEDDIDRWYPFLARAALLDFTKNYSKNPDIQSWNTGLANHFVDMGRSRWHVARAIAKALCDAAPADAFLLTARSSVLRRTERPAEAMTMLKNTGDRFRNHRDVLYEWSTVAGAIGDHGLAAWLGGKSLADGGELRARQCMLSFAGLGVVFRELFAKLHNKAFVAAQAACGQLGLRLPEVNERTRSYFEAGIAEGRRNGVAELPPERAMDTILIAVGLGADEVEPENLKFFEGLLGDPGGYRYTTLLHMVRTGEKTGQRR